MENSSTILGPSPIAVGLALPRRKFEINLEALRGVAAIVVLWDHLSFYSNWLDPTYLYRSGQFFLSAGHICVLIFFLLSGYVIGLAHRTPLATATIPSYLKKRFVRLYPIYFVCLLFTLVVTKTPYSFATSASHFTMTQGVTSPVIWAIAPAWSLAYEVAFYLLFIPISVFRINPIPVALFMALLGVAVAYLAPYYSGAALLSSYAFGFAFWLIGLSLAKYLQTPTTRVCYSTMVSLLLLLIALGKLDAPVTLWQQLSLKLIGRNLSLPSDQPATVLFRDLGYLPYCLVTLLAFTSKTFRGQKILLCLLYALPALTFYSYYKHFNAETLSSLLVPTVCYLIALICFVFPRQTAALAERIVLTMIPSGSFSYGLYIVHFPLLYAFGCVTAFSGNAFTFAVRGLLFLLLSGVLAYTLDKKFQPWVRQLIG